MQTERLTEGQIDRRVGLNYRPRGKQYGNVCLNCGQGLSAHSMNYWYGRFLPNSRCPDGDSP